MRHLAVLVSSVGRRSQLISCFRESLDRLGIAGRVIGIDASRNAPARFLVDQFHQVPRCTEGGFIGAVHNICIREDVRVVVPTIDTELMVYARSAAAFAAAGVILAVSAPETVAIAADKVKTNQWLRENGFPTVRQASPEDVLRDNNWKFPVILKPRGGSASVGVHGVASRQLLEALAAEGRDLIVEEKAEGREFTINAYVNREGRCLCAVPHLRVEVRAGEVSKGITVRDPELIELGTRIANRLPGAFGALNIQAFADQNRPIHVSEINARFGGGYPLAHRAGAEMSTWLLEEALGLPLTASADNWEAGMTMLRYDDAVFLSAAETAAVL